MNQMKLKPFILFCLLLSSSMKTFAADTDIRLNSLGFFPAMDKSASIIAACSNFSVMRVADGTKAYSGTVSGPTNNFDTGENIYLADFSSLTESGMFYLSVDGVGRSPDFPIKNDVFDAPFYTVMRALYLSRCGTAVTSVYNGTTFHHAACHTSDAYLDYIGGGRTNKPSLKGWHDAGDYNKYVVNAGITIGTLLRAWEQFKPALAIVKIDIPETGGIYPDYLAEIKWELDWLFTTQFNDGSVSHKVSATSFCGYIMPESDNANRFYVPWGSAATADFVAMMAMAARCYQPYDSPYAQQCLSAAVKSYNFLAANLQDHQADQTGFSTGTYTTTDPDDRLWAAAEMWETTGEQKYLEDFETRATNQAPYYVDIDFDWGNVKNLGMFTYLLSGRNGKNQALVDSVTHRLLSAADSAVTIRNQHGYKRPLGGSYYWGCNGSTARQTMLLQVANVLSPNAKYLNTSVDAIGYLFGRNCYGRSFVTGLGTNPPMNPHDRRSIADGITPPWPGYLVGGAWPNANSWVDIDTNYQTNEIAINWQSALIYAMAGFISSPGNSIKQQLPGVKKEGISKPGTIMLINGQGKTTIPAGRTTIFDCQGRYLKEITARKEKKIDLRELGLHQGAVILHIE
jgi:endoglucanase